MTSVKGVLPIILCGKSTNVASAVSKALQPQISVTHTYLSVESAKEEIPKVLKIRDDSRPVAVMLGGAFDDQAFSEIRNSVSQAGEKTTWLRKDTNQKASISPSESQSGYGEEVALRAKELLLKLASNQSLYNPSNDVEAY